jgi:FKBP-type peptidyl-prolyl cis-trans isomerase
LRTCAREFILDNIAPLFMRLRMTFYTKITAAVAGAAIALSPAASVSAAKPAAKKTAKSASKPASCKKLTKSGLGYTVLKSGKGAMPGAQDKVKINYRGTLATTGAEFDANQGIKFGVSQVIPGFAEGLQLMPVGSKYRLCIPAKMAYAERALDGIPANSDLVFEIDMLGITPAPPLTLTRAPDRQCAMKTPSGLGYQAMEMGSGPNPSDADYVLVGYAGYLSKDGTRFDENSSAAFPVSGVVPGFAEGLKLMQKGARYRFCIPAALGYGEQGAGASIPPNADLVFMVELLDLRTPADLKALDDAEGKTTAQ